MCCIGVPYPPEGVCLTDCPLDSDRNLKQGFAAVDDDEILRRLATLPITEWSYRNQDPGVRHVGPIAQE